MSRATAQPTDSTPFWARWTGTPAGSENVDITDTTADECPVFIKGIDNVDFLQVSVGSDADLPITWQLLLSDPVRPDADGNPSIIRVIEFDTDTTSTNRFLQADNASDGLGIILHQDVILDMRGINSREPNRLWHLSAITDPGANIWYLLNYAGINIPS
jgi:hypothetical protein